jgi:hypothetical protein
VVNVEARDINGCGIPARPPRKSEAKEGSSSHERDPGRGRTTHSNGKNDCCEVYDHDAASLVRGFSSNGRKRESRRIS